MKRVSLILPLTCFFLHAFTQDQKIKNDSVNVLVQTYFNAKNADSLYALAGNAFRKISVKSSSQPFATITFFLWVQCNHSLNHSIIISAGTKQFLTV